MEKESKIAGIPLAIILFLIGVGVLVGIIDAGPNFYYFSQETTHYKNLYNEIKGLKLTVTPVASASATPTLTATSTPTVPVKSFVPFRQVTVVPTK